MARRQQRISFTGGVPETKLPATINWCTLVKIDNSVIFVKVVKAGKEQLEIRNQRGRNEIVPTKMIREIIIDTHA